MLNQYELDRISEMSENDIIKAADSRGYIVKAVTGPRDNKPGYRLSVNKPTERRDEWLEAANIRLWHIQLSKKGA